MTRASLPGNVRAAALTLLLAAAPARAAVRVLMVGIDHYANSIAHDPAFDPKFHDLTGAVNDLGTLPAVLVAKAHLAIAPVTAGCQAVTAASIILTDACAPLAAIVGAWNRLATASAAGDTLLFYYSGHGSTVIDASDTQESGSSDTLVPFDARGRGHNPELIDLDIKALIDMATARGVNVVTIFDSCNSGTATRAFSNDLARAIPRGVAPRRPLPPPVGPGAHPGYRVHLSAAADGQTAVERGGHGLFTGALAAAITAAPDATYGDLITRVRATLAAEPQTAGIEGALTARFLGPPPPPGRAFTGRVAGDAVVLDFGTLSLVTTGSRFAVFASSTAAAAAGAVPLTTGTIIAATTHTARLTLGGASAGGDCAGLRNRGGARLRRRADPGRNRGDPGAARANRGGAGGDPGDACRHRARIRCPLGGAARAPADRDRTADDRLRQRRSARFRGFSSAGSGDAPGR